MLQFGLSFLELDLVGEALDVDVHLAPFSVPHHGRYEEERDELREQAEAAMAARGLLVDDRLAPYVERAVTLLAVGEPSISVDGTGPRGPLRARAVLDAREAVFVLDSLDGGVHVTLSGVDDVVGWVLGLLPQYKRATGESVTVVVTDPDRPERVAADEDFSQLSYTVGGSGPADRRQRDLRAAERLFSRRELGSGRIVVETRERRGRQGVYYVIDWIDKDTGRYIGYATFSSDGTESRVYTPGDYPLFASKLQELIGACAEALVRAGR